MTTGPFEEYAKRLQEDIKNRSSLEDRRPLLLEVKSEQAPQEPRVVKVTYLRSPEEERLFRRGYHLGAEAFALAQGCSVDRFRGSAWSHRLQEWEEGDLRCSEDPPEWPTPSELEELLGGGQ